MPFCHISISSNLSTLSNDHQSAQSACPCGDRVVWGNGSGKPLAEAGQVCGCCRNCWCGSLTITRLQRIAPDSLRIVWLGADRPVSEARLFVADAEYQPLRSLLVAGDRREGHFRLTIGEHRAEYAGVAIVHADGSRKTVLIPLRELH